MGDNKPKKRAGDEVYVTDNETISSSALEKPFVKEFADIPGEDGLPNIENDYTRAKAYLLKQYMETGDNLWDHLTELLKKIISERPKGIADTFEEFSLKMRENRFREQTDHLRDLYIPPEHYDLSQKLLQLLHPGVGVMIPEKNDEDEDEPKVRPDLMELLYFFEQAGVGLPRHEMFCIALHIKKLVANQPIEKCRFWGKILGLYKNYYVAETELKEDESVKRNMEREEAEEKLKLENEEKETLKKEEERAQREMELEQAKQREIDLAAERTEAIFAQIIKLAEEAGLEERPEPPNPLKPWPVIPPLPRSSFKQNPECPGEPTGIGINKKVYFVCNDPGDDWVELPDVTPQQIVAARNIKRFMTGYLDSPVTTYPAFPGTEKNYIRAQIARISAATQISPLGFYTFNEEEEPEPEEEGGAGKTNYMENPDYEPVAIKDLTDNSMAFWVHHTPYILKQGRTTWWNPSSKSEEGGGEDEEGGEEEEGGEVERESGPELLTPLSEDAALDSTVPWSARSTSALFPEFSVALVRSNLWPGAYAFATNKKFDNVYIGFGHKFAAHNHSPLPILPIQEEYPLGPEIMEMTDPTPEEEEEWRLAHEKKLPLGGEGEEEQEENEDEDEDE